MKKSRVKMFFRCSHMIWISILCEAVSGDNVMKAVNSETVFTPVSGSVSPSTTSITWKHRDNGVVVKVIEWEQDDDSIVIPNTKFRSHASLDKQTGELTLTNLQLKHTGVYTLDISGKEQRKQFSLTVIEPVRKPYIKKECELGDVPICALSCEGDDGASGSTVVWQSSGETLHRQDRQTRTITVTESSDPDNSYTCTLKSAVNEETSDPVYDRDLFHDSFTISDIAIIIVSVIAVFLFLILFIWCLWPFRKRCLQMQSIFTDDELSRFHI